LLSFDEIEQASGVPADQIASAGKALAQAPQGIIILGQDVLRTAGGFNNTLNALDLLLITGKLDHERSGLAVLTEENNEQGALEMGVVPEYLPGPSGTMDDGVVDTISEKWGREPASGLGLRLPDMIEAARDGRVKALYVVGENPLESLPSSCNVSDGLEKLDLLICQELFMTETAKLSDIVFPACSYAEKDGSFTNSEGIVQKVRRALDPVGDSHPDWEIFTQLSGFMGFPMDYESVKQIQDEINCFRPSVNEKVRVDRDVLDGFFKSATSGESIIQRYAVIEEIVDQRTPLTLVVGQSLFHSGRMSTFAKGLNAIQNKGELLMHPDDGSRYDVRDGSLVKIASEYGKAVVPVKFNERRPQGTVFFPEHFKRDIDAVLSMVTDPLTAVPYCRIEQVSITPVHSEA